MACFGPGASILPLSGLGLAVSSPTVWTSGRRSEQCGCLSLSVLGHAWHLRGHDGLRAFRASSFSCLSGSSAPAPLRRLAVVVSVLGLGGGVLVRLLWTSLPLSVAYMQCNARAVISAELGLTCSVDFGTQRGFET
jgi:hypothetical protein